ncbi:hypothetical protein B0A48_00419 [Cryoendolithus antarcticus]|uniref:Uncharacterized protein n=1 Tax=Cryoendolithus antarcticus TaxID=1507870 RepID=A0A1V8TUL5_9PEZI|nr:hypothetical protein B0A48_00419 [Cryoendolithus antarcticus]
MFIANFFRAQFREQAFDGNVSGEHIVSWYQDLFSDSTTYASILASVMFSSMIQDLDEKLYSPVQRHHIRTYSAAGAVLFVCLVLLCQGFALVLKFHSGILAREYDSKDRGVRIMLQAFSLLFQQVLLVGTVFFCLVVKVYHVKIGLTGLVITFVAISVSFGSWLVTAAIEVRSQRKKGRGEPWTTAKSALEQDQDRDRRAAAKAEEEANGKDNVAIPTRINRQEEGLVRAHPLTSIAE